MIKDIIATRIIDGYWDVVRHHVREQVRHHVREQVALSIQPRDDAFEMELRQIITFAAARVYESDQQ